MFESSEVYKELYIVRLEIRHCALQCVRIELFWEERRKCVRQCYNVMYMYQNSETDTANIHRFHSHSATHHTRYTDAGVLKSRGRSKLPSCPQRLTSSLQENSDYVSLHGPVGVSSVTILPSTHQGLSLRLVPSTHPSFHHFRTLTGLSSDQGHPGDFLLRPTRERESSGKVYIEGHLDRQLSLLESTDTEKSPNSLQFASWPLETS